MLTPNKIELIPAS